MHIDVLMVTFNNGATIRPCLQSLTDQSIHRIIVVDNSSRDDTVAIIDEMRLRDNRIELVTRAVNAGFASSVNVAFMRATASAVLILNPDTIVDPGAIREMAAEFKNPEVGIVGPRLVLADGKLDPASSRYAPTFTSAVMHLIPRFRHRARYLDRNPGPYVEAISGACMLIGSDTFRRVGGFDEDYWMYGEDLDLCLRVRRDGLYIRFAERARVRHIKGSSKPVGAPRRGFKATYHFYAALGLYYTKNLSKGRISSSAAPLVRLGASSLGLVAGLLNASRNLVHHVGDRRRSSVGQES